jgi:hypothetical protein
MMRNIYINYLEGQSSKEPLYHNTIQEISSNKIGKYNALQINR